MSIGQSPKIVTNGLVFYKDLYNSKSFVGAPTTNYAYLQNPRIDSSYASYSATSSGTWNAHHPDAIRVYNDAGTEITSYVNTGVTDWTNTWHAIWTYDDILQRPVVTMRDVNGNWKAKSWNTGQTMTSMGLGYGSQYTISWLQWTDNISKAANAGLYGLNTSGSNGFHDGQSNSFATAFNTKTHTWQRVYATFTVSAVRNLGATLSCYMYGHYTTRGTVKIADVQIEALPYPTGFSKAQTRSNTQAITDMIGSTVLTANNMSYAANEYSFNGTSSYLLSSSPGLSTVAGSGSKTFIVWCQPDSTGPANTYTGLVALGTHGTTNPSGTVLLSLNTTNSSTYYVSSAYWGNDYVPNNVVVTPNAWNMVGIVARGAGTTNNTTLFCGNANGLSFTTGNSSNYAYGLNTTNANLTIGCTDVPGRYFKGKIGNVLIYDKELSTAEITQVYQALRSRYGV